MRQNLISLLTAAELARGEGGTHVGFSFMAGSGIPMSTHPEGQGRPESDPPGGLVEVLSRWADCGGHWKVLESGADWVDIGLYTCDGGEQMSRVSGALTSALRSYLTDRSSSLD